MIIANEELGGQSDAYGGVNAIIFPANVWRVRVLHNAGKRDRYATSSPSIKRRSLINVDALPIAIGE